MLSMCNNHWQCCNLCTRQALERMGAVFIEGTENVVVTNSVFERQVAPHARTPVHLT